MKAKLFLLSVAVASAFSAMQLAGCKGEGQRSFNGSSTSTQDVNAGGPGENDVPAVLTGSKGRSDLGKNAASSVDNLITLSGANDRNTYHLGQQTEGYLYLEVKAGKFEPKDKKRAPLNISLVIDRSGSMSGDKLKYVKKAAQFVVENLGSEDILSIVMYDDEVSVVYPSSRVTDKDAVKRKIERIEDNGSTNLGGGMLEGYAQVKSTYRSGYVNRVLLLSDGLANVGIQDPNRLEEIVKAKNREEGITLSAFGVGNDFNEDLMTNLAEHGSGNYYFIGSPENIPDIFGREMKGLLAVVAQNARLDVILPEGVTLTQVFGYTHEMNGRNISISFRDIISEETKAVLVKYSIAAGTRGDLSFASSLSFDDATADHKRKKLSIENIVKPTEDQLAFKNSLNDKVQEQVVLFESNYRMEQAMKEVDNGNYDQARTIIESNSGYFKENEKWVNSSEELQRQSMSNTTYQDKIKEAETMEHDEKAAMQKSTKSDNYNLRKKK